MIAAATGNAVGIAGMAFPAQLLIAKVVDSDGTIEHRRRGERRSAGRSISGARVINLSLGGASRPVPPEPGHVLDGRAGGDRLRRPAAARSSSQRSGTATTRRGAVAVRALSGRAAARGRGQRAHRQGQRAGVLEPRRALQRPRRARRRDPLVGPAGADREAAVVRRPGLLRLRPTRVPAGEGPRSRRRRSPRPRRCCSRCGPA